MPEEMDTWSARQAEQDSLQRDDFAAAVRDTLSFPGCTEADFDLGQIPHKSEGNEEIDPFDDIEVLAETDPVPGEVAPDVIPLATARAMGFRPEEIFALQEAGVVERPAGSGWREPETVEDMERVLWRCKQAAIAADGILATAQREADELLTQAAARAKPLQKAAENWKRYEVLFQQLTIDALPKTKKGAFKSKSIPLGRVTVRLKSSAGGPAVVDEAAVLAYIQEQRTAERPVLLDAVQATRTETVAGDKALEAIENEAGWRPKVLLKPVKDFVAALPPVPHAETGEKLPATIPGVVIAAPTETFSFD